MVKMNARINERLYLLFFLCLGVCGLISFKLSALGEIYIDASVDARNAFVNYPLHGTISVTHDAKDTVDVSNFSMEGKPLPVDFVKSVSMFSNQSVLVSFYRFQLSGKPAGTYILPPVSVKVGGNVYQSIPSSYEVAGAVPQTATVNTTPAALKLKAEVQSPKPFFPGQQARLVYYFLFKGNIELTSETLPLIDKISGFQKIGDKQIKNYQSDEWSIQEVSQEVQAVNPGDFTFPASTIEGYAYQQDPIQKTRTYFQPILKAEAPSVTITVSQFPSGAPSTFQGAVGKYAFKVSLLTPSSVYVEDRMKLAVDITTLDSSLDTVTLPSLNQPGFQGLFRSGDLPPVGEVQGKTKRFVFDIYPLVPSIEQIPSFTFSYFDPSKATYQSLQSDPIPITVKARAPIAPQQPPQEVKEKEVQTPQETKEETAAPKAIEVQKPQPIEIEGIYTLTSSDLKNTTLGTWWGLLLIPLGAFFLGFLYELRKYLLLLKERIKPKQSEEIWKEALASAKDPPKFFPLMRKALLMRLEENDIVASANIDPENLPNEGQAGEVREFLCRIEKERFAGKDKFPVEPVVKEAKALFYKIKK